MEVKDVKGDILELKESVANLRTVLTGFQDHLHDIASQLKSRAEVGDLSGKAGLYPQASRTFELAPENQL